MAKRVIDYLIKELKYKHNFVISEEINDTEESYAKNGYFEHIFCWFVMNNEKVIKDIEKIIFTEDIKKSLDFHFEIKQTRTLIDIDLYFHRDIVTGSDNLRILKVFENLQNMIKQNKIQESY